MSEEPTKKQEWLAEKIHILLGVPLPEKRTKASMREFISANLTIEYKNAYNRVMHRGHRSRSTGNCDFTYDGEQEDDIPGASGIGADWSCG